jgi:hypothetical protein
MRKGSTTICTYCSKDMTNLVAGRASRFYGQNVVVVEAAPIPTAT